MSLTRADRVRFGAMVSRFVAEAPGQSPEERTQQAHLRVLAELSRLYSEGDDWAQRIVRELVDQASATR